MPKKLSLLLTSIIICQLAGLIGTIFTISAIPTWYIGLIKPDFSPPNFIFGPVWIILYTLMGISLYLVWKKGTKKGKNREALVVFSIQLFLNAIWSIIFFGLKNPGLAFAEIILMWVLIVATMYKFWSLDKRATYLLVPYLLWVSFASFLNYSIWVLNS